MDKKNLFKKSLLSSAIIAATLKSLSGTAVAGTCPPPDTSGNIHVSSGEYCEGGISVDPGSPPVNDIGLEGFVVGDIVNNDGISDFWVNSGTLDGSFINNDTAQDIRVTNGSEIFADIRNQGDMRYLTVEDGPATPTVIHGSIVNTGDIDRVRINGNGARVKGDIINADAASINGELTIGNGASVAGSVLNDGDGEVIFVDGNASVGENLVNNGNLFVLAVVDGSAVGGNFENNGNAMFFVADDNSSVGGSMVNTGNNMFAGVLDGSAVTGDFRNEGFIDGGMVVDNSTVSGGVINEGYADGLYITDGSAIGSLDNLGSTSYIGIFDSQVEENVTNHGDVLVDPNSNRYFIPDGSGSMPGDHTVAGIAIDSESTVSGNVANHGVITNFFMPPPPDTPGRQLNHSLAGISIDHGSSVDDIINTGSIEVTAMLEHNGPEFMDGVHANGIQVKNGSTSGSILNDGNIIADTFGIYVDGSGNDGVTVEGSIHNQLAGTIFTQDNGIYIHQAEVTGNVSNDGHIQSTEDNAIDIEDSLIGGSVINTGSLMSNDDYDVIDIDDSTIAGDVINTVTGDISGEDGIDIDDSTVAGSVINDGFITAVDEGFDIDQSDIGVDVVNNGSINAGGIGIVIEGDLVAPDGPPPEAGTEPPPPVIDYVTIGRDFINSGEIIAGETGISMEYVDIAGNFDSSGSIQAGPQGPLPDGGASFNGIELEDVRVGGNVTLGDVSASGSGVTMDSTMIGGDLVSTGSITGIQEDAINLDDVDIGGSLQTSGDLIAAYDGIELSDVTIVGELNNSGNITAENGSGIVLDYNVTVGEGFTNSGEITANDYGISLVGDRWIDMDGQLVTDGLVSIGGDFVNSGDITSGNHGINVSDVTIGGGFSNSGDITTGDGNGNYAINIEGHSQIGGDIVNTGNLTGGKGIRLRGEAELVDGQLVDGSIVTVAGGLLNNGDIQSSNDSIRLTGVDLGGNLENHGSLVNTGSNAIDVENSIIRGNVVNTGSINSTGSEGLDIDYSVVTGSIVNTGDITADSDPIIIEYSRIHGDIINDGNLVARDNDTLEIEGAWIGGSVINNGTLHAGDRGIEIDGYDDGMGDTIIEGNLENHGDIYSVASELVNNDGDSAIDIDDLTVKGHFINTGDLHARYDGYDIDEMSVGKNWINDGNITAGVNGFDIEGTRVWHDGEETIDGMTPGYHTLKPVTVGGAFVNNGDINAGETGIEFELVSVGTNGVTEDGQANFDNSGNILAEDGSAMDLRAVTVTGDFINSGDLDAQKALTTVEEGDGVGSALSPPYDIEDGISYHRGISLTAQVFDEDGEHEELVKSAVGGIFKNSGNISAVDQGIHIMDTDIGGNVENSGNITSERATGIDIATATIGGNFINSGNIDTSGEVLSQEGDHYRSEWSGTLSADGEVVLQARGRDEAGNAWFVVRNESESNHGLELQEQNGDFATQYFEVAPGEEIYINAGQIEGDLDLAYDGMDGVIATAGATDWGFSPQSEPQHGISLVDTTVDGDFGNSGNITSNNHGINLQDMSVAGKLVNTGDISAEDTAINLDGNITIGDGINNTGDLSGEHGISLVSNASMESVTDADGITLVMDTADGVISVGGNLTNSGDINTRESGIKLKGVLLGGGLGNQGNITAEGGNAIQLDDVIVDGNIENYGVLTVNKEQSGDGIDIDQSIVKGSVINFGTMNIQGTEGLDIEDSVIEGSVVNAADGELNVRSDGFYIEDTHIKGSLLNYGTIIAKEHDGIDVQVEEFMDGDSPIIARIDGSLISTGNITAGDNGIELDGARKNSDTNDTPDGVVTVPAKTVKLEIGGKLDNSGDITAKDSGIDLELVSVGADGVLEDGQANFENHGTITAGEGSTIKLVASDVAGDFINTGDLSVVNDDMYSEGDQYRRQGGETSPEGSITLTAVGTDSEGNTWFRIKNEGNNSTPVSLTEQGGGFNSGYIELNSGQEVYITVGKDSDGSENYVLSELEDGPFGQPAVDGELAVAAADLGTDFQPAYKVGGDAGEQRGISLTGKVYDKGGESEELIRTTVAGNVSNTGKINALDEGIYLNQVDVGGNVVNDGHIDSLQASTIDLSDVNIDGHIVNTGNLNASQEYTYQEGDSYTKDWDGTPSEDGEVVLVSQGVDENGNQWFVVRNEGDNHQNFMLEEADGDFATTDFSLEPGQEVYINAGELEGDLQLRHPWSGDLIAAAGVAGDGFTPEYNDRNGISVVDATVGGHFVNQGNIAVIDEGIYLENVDFGGQVENHGNITSDLAGFVLKDATVNGPLINSGDIEAGEEGLAVVSSIVTGPILNTGNITSDDQGILIEDSDLGATENGTAAVQNSEKLVTGKQGILIRNSDLGHQPGEDGAMIYGNVVNTSEGVITSAHSGMELDNVSGVGDFINAGEINAGQGESDDGLAVGMLADGVTMNGIVANTGTINAKEAGIAVLDTDGATGLYNHGEITTDGYGMIAGESVINGDIINGIVKEVDGVQQVEGVINAGYVGMMLGELEGVNNIINNGGINVTYGDGATVYGSGISGIVANNGTIEAGRSGFSLYGVDGTSFVNNSSVNAGTFTGDGEGPGPEAYGNGMGLFDSHMSGLFSNNAAGIIKAATDGMITRDVDGLTGFVNLGTVEAGNHGMNAYDTTITGNFGNTGTLTAGVDGLRLEGSTVNSLVDDGVSTGGHVINDTGGVINAGDDGIRISNAQVSGAVINRGSVTAGENAIDIDLSQIGSGIVNSGLLTSTDTAIDIGSTGADGSASVGALTNTGTVASTEGAAIRVAKATVGQIVNTGTLNGGLIQEPEVPVEPSAALFSVVNSGIIAGSTDGIGIDTSPVDGGSFTNSGELVGINNGINLRPAAERELNYSNAVAIDYRNADSALDLVNGTDSASNTGIINGDIYGSSLDSDKIELSAGEMNGDIYDVENIDITGTITHNNDIFSFNDSSTLTVTDTGTLEMGLNNKIAIQGDYVQEGDTTLVLDQNENNFADPRISATDNATLGADSTFAVSFKDRDLANFNPGDGNSYTVRLVASGNGNVVDNGASIVSETITVNLEKINDENGFAAIGSINDLGVLASGGGADNNASNALSALQGTDSAGYIALQESNPDLYNAIYDGSEASLATLAEQLVASPENGIAAGQAAQAEAVNTILTRIAELRTGASGISAGDSATSASDYVRPDSLWIRAIYSDGEQDATSNNGNNYNSYALRSKGFTIGADKDVSDTLTLGVGVTVANSTANEKGSSQQRANSKTDTYLGSLYAGWRDQDYFADASINYGKGKTNLKGADWEADYDSSQIGISVLAGKSFLFNNNDSLIEPRVGLNYTRLETDKYSYQTNSEQVTVGSQNLESLELGAGVRFITGIEVGSGTLLPEASLMAWHDFKGDEVKANVEFETGGGSFTYFGPKAEKTRYQAGIGAEYLMDNNFTVSVNYEHNWQSGFKADTWVAKLRYDF